MMIAVEYILKTTFGKVQNKSMQNKCMTSQMIVIKTTRLIYKAVLL